MSVAARASRVGIAVAAVGVAALLTAALAMRTVQSSRRAQSTSELLAMTPEANEEQGFVTSATCRACHPSEYASWHGTFHRTMTQRATPEAVLGDFSGVDVMHAGRPYRFERRGDEFWVIVDGRERRIVMTTGSHHYQVYWVRADSGDRLENIPLVHLIEDDRWVARSEVFIVPPSALENEWKPRAWELSCIACHATHGRPGYDESDQTVDSEVAELGIACESCHGPAHEHVEANRSMLRRAQMHRSDEPDPTIVNPARLDHRRASQVCAQCHSVFHFEEGEAAKAWEAEGFAYRAGDDLHATRSLVRHPKRLPAAEQAAAVAALQHDRFPLHNFFWRDGRIRVLGREYTALVETGCYQSGELSCLSCHSMHDSDPDDQLRRDIDGDESCLQCHEELRADPAAHTHHLPASSGARCQNCHMPHTTYGTLRALRSHDIDSPTVQETLESARPNACNLCHLDRPLAWSASHLEAWYGQPAPPMLAEDTLLSSGLLAMLRGDAGQRAILAWHFGWDAAHQASGSEWMAPFLALLLDDDYPPVRYIASGSLKRLPGYADFDYDYVGSPEEQTKAVQRALALWSGAPESAESAGSTAMSPILLRRDGTLREDLIREILKRRDRRPMFLAE